MYIVFSNSIFASFINNDNRNITNKLEHLLFIYNKSIKKIKLIYFLKYKEKIALLKSHYYKNKNLILNRINNNAQYRLYNGLKIKQNNIDKLSQKILKEEAEKYPYFPKINQYDLIYQNYYVVNNSFSNMNNMNNKTEKDNNYNNVIQTEVHDVNKKYNIFKNEKLPKINNEKNQNYFILKNNYNDYIEKKYNNNFANKNMYYNSIIKKKLALLDELKKEEENKMNNKTLSKIVDYKNKIPNNFKKKKTKNMKNKKNSNQNELLKKEINQNQNQISNSINYNLISYYPSPNIKKDYNIDNNNNDLIIQNYSHQNSELLNDEKSKNNTYYSNSSKNNSFQNKIYPYNNNKIILSPNNNNISDLYSCNYIYNSSKSDLPKNNIIRDCTLKNKVKSNSFKFLPKNECSLILIGRKNKSNINTKRNDIYNKISIDYKKRKNKISNRSNLNNRALNSIGLIDNSLSTNFYDRQSINDNPNHTLSINDNFNNNHNSIIYNKANRNISYTFPSKDNIGSNSFNNENLNNKVYFKKISNYKKIGKKNQRKIYNRIMIEQKFDNGNSNTINTDSSSKNRNIKNNDNFKEKIDNFNIINELFYKKENNLNNLNILEIASGEVDENVNNKRIKHEKTASMSQRSEPVTIQSMSDSKILEIANYYLNEEETVDKIEIDDILLTKNIKNNSKDK